MSVIKQGTVSVTNGSEVVTGTGTNWLGQVAPGQVFALVGEVSYTIASVASDTSLTLTVPYGGTTKSGQTYSVTRDFTTGGLPLLAPGTVSASGVLNPVVQALEDANNARLIAQNPGDVAESAALRPVGATSDTDIPDKGLLRTEYGLRKALSVQPTLSSDFTRNEHKVYEQYGLEPKTITQQWDVTRNGTATYVDATGKIRTAGIDEPRITFDPEAGENLGLLVEESRTNLLLWSEDFTQSDWNKSGAAVTELVGEAPNGGSAWLVETDGTSSGNRIEQIITPEQNKTYVMSIYTRNINNHFRVNLRTSGGTENTEEFLSLPSSNSTSDWVRRELSIDVGDSTSLQIRPLREAFSGASSAEIALCQLEQAPTPSSYIPTTDMQITRPADNVVRTLGDEFNPRAFTIYADITVPDSDRIGSTLALNPDGEAASRVVWEFLTSFRLRWGVNYTGAAPSLMSQGLSAGRHKIAWVFDGERMALFADGLLTGQQSGDFSDFISRMNDGNPVMLLGQNSTNSFYANTEIAYVGLSPKPITDAELQELTKI